MTKPTHLIGAIKSTCKLHTFNMGGLLENSDEQDSTSSWLLVKGYIKRYYIRSDGNISIQSIYQPNDLFSLTRIYRILFNQTIYDGEETYYYEAITKAQLYKVPIPWLEKIIQKEPRIYKEIILQTGKQLQLNTQQIESIGLHDSYHRVAHTVLYLAKHYSTIKDGIYIIDVPLSQQDIADILSLTRETVSTSLTKLRRQK